MPTGIREEISCFNRGIKTCSSTSRYLARMVYKSCNTAFASGVNNMLPVNLKEITGTLILLSFPRLVFHLSFVGNPLPNNFTHILYNLNYFDAKLQNGFILLNSSNSVHIEKTELMNYHRATRNKH
jgi:hypothetical protein